MSFRLLGLVGRLDEIDVTYGQLLKSYAQSGAEVTLASLTGTAGERSVVRELGLLDLILLDRTGVPEASIATGGLLESVITAFRPHVVIATSNQSPTWSAVEAAVAMARKTRSGGWAMLPAKLYYRQSRSTPAVAVTTAVRVPGGTSRALFVRAFPQPWVTGVLETDLFCGIAEERDDARWLAAAS